MAYDQFQLLDTIQNISQDLEKNEAFLGEEHVALFQSNFNKLKNNLEEVMKTNRQLKIGIVGEVKAGKSSFINALIFEGKDILPKAPTPMTAALTKITYGETFESEIFFYDENDWKLIEANAAKADAYLENLYEMQSQTPSYRAMNFTQFCLLHKDEVPKEYAGCKELTTMVEKNQLNVYDYIGQSEIISSDTQEDYMEKLNQYVGADGQFTPLVKYTVIKMKNERLKNIEIVDTPGMNDPIVSRTLVTSDFLIGCDVVLFLSYAGQFLTQEEMSLLTNSLPENSINHAYLIASKFDSAMLDYKQRKATLKEALQHTVSNLRKQAKTTIDGYVEKPDAPAVVKAISQNLPPHPISGLLYSCAMKIHRNEPLNDGEEHILKNFEKRFEGFERTPKSLLQLANIHGIEQKVLKKVKEDKNQIIEERTATMIEDQQVEFLRLIRQMEDQIYDNMQDLKHSDVSSLQKRVEMISSKLYSIRKSVSDIFDVSYVKAASCLTDIKVDVDKEISNHTGVNVVTSTTTADRSRKTGFLKLKTEYYTVTRTEYTTEAREVVTSIREFITKSREMINREFKRLFDLQQMKKEISTEVIGAFELVEDDFNEAHIKRALDVALTKITIQDLQIDQTKYDKQITDNFSATVENEDIAKLQLAQERLLQEIANDIKKEIDKKIKAIELTLEKHSATFIDDIEKQIVKNAEKIKTMLKNKETSLKSMENIAKQLKGHKQSLSV